VGNTKHMEGLPALGLPRAVATVSARQVPSSAKLRQVKEFWAGFSDNRLDVREIDDGFGGWGEGKRKSPMLFTSYSAARREYRDVRKVAVKMSAGSRARDALK